MNTLRKFSLLSNCSDDSIEYLYHCCRYESVKKNTAVLAAGDLTDEIIILASGELALRTTNEKGQEFTVTRLSVGGWFGEAAFIPETQVVLTVRALEDSIIVKIPVSDVFKLCEIDTNVMKNAIISMATRARSIGKFSLNNMTTSSSLKILRTILFHIEVLDTKYQSCSAELKLTRSELAHIVGLSRPALDKYLKPITQSGLVSYGYGVLTVFSVDALRKQIALLEKEVASSISR